MLIQLVTNSEPTVIWYIDAYWVIHLLMGYILGIAVISSSKFNHILLFVKGHISISSLWSWMKEIHLHFRFHRCLLNVNFLFLIQSYPPCMDSKNEHNNGITVHMATFQNKKIATRSCRGTQHNPSSSATKHHILPFWCVIAININNYLYAYVYFFV